MTPNYCILIIGTSPTKIQVQNIWLRSSPCRQVCADQHRLLPKFTVATAEVGDCSGPAVQGYIAVV